MIPEIGQFVLLLALGFALCLSVVPVWGVSRRDDTLQMTYLPLAVLTFVLTLGSFLILVFSFLQDDFTLVYAAQNSNSLLPWYYKVSAVWGAHEGSMLLWVLILTGWTLAVALASGTLPLSFRALVVAVQGMLTSGFLLFIALTSNPFARLLPFGASDGSDLNPLLQDFGLIVHPPVLYMGYVGLSVAFSFAVAALVLGRLDGSWARWLRPWTNTAWAFLTCGIALGSWWAYYELGWGGWWFWDPVENASLMPWLAGTALVHSLAVAEKRGIFKRWTLLLALSAFSLSLLGTFLVRSGVLTSVHAFASDPERGLFILLFLAAVIGSSLFLFGWRLNAMTPTSGFQPISREAALLINNLLFVLMTSVVLIGTLYPLIIDILGIGSVSIGAPYFNLFTALIIGPMLILMAVGQRMRWRQDEAKTLVKQANWPGMLALLLGTVLGFLMVGGFSWPIAIGTALAVWIVGQGLMDLKDKLGERSRWSYNFRRISPSYWGMQLAHLGVAVTLIGILFSVALSASRDVRLAPDDRVELAGYEFHLQMYRSVEGPNYIAEEAVVSVSKNGRHVADLYPQKRRYFSGQNTLTEAGINGSIWRDLYVSMGEPLQGGAWAVRVYVKPFVRWIWAGALFMALGACLAVLDRRYQRVRNAEHEQPDKSIAQAVLSS